MIIRSAGRCVFFFRKINVLNFKIRGQLFLYGEYFTYMGGFSARGFYLPSRPGVSDEKKRQPRGCRYQIVSMCPDYFFLKSRTV